MRKLKKVLKGRATLIALVLVSILLISEVVILAKPWGEMSFAAHAQKIVNRCADASYKPTCYDDEIPKLMSSISMEDAFEVTKIVQDLDYSYQYCHVLGHKLAAVETAKDPSDWKTVMGRCPSGVCSNGCIHGAFQERFRKEYLSPVELESAKDEFRNVCEEREGFNPTGLEQGSCYHALGHLTMYVTNADIDASLGLCRELAVVNGRDWSQLCFDGVFMQIFQPLEPDDFTLIEGKEVETPKEHKEMCNRYSGMEKGSCWSEGWPLYREELLEPGKLVSHCSYLADLKERNRCFSALIYVLTPQMGFDSGRISAFCSAMPKQYAGNCFAQAAGRLIETDYRNSEATVALCVEGAPYDPEDLCFKGLLLYSTYNFHPGSVESISFCSAMPDDWKMRCLDRTNSIQ